MMFVIDHAALSHESTGGRQRVAVANPRLGVRSLEVWLELLEPGASASISPHDDALQVLYVASGRGYLLTGRTRRLVTAPCSKVLPGDRDCCIVNSGSERMELVLAASLRF